MRIRLHIDIETNEEFRALLAEAVVEQPLVQVQIGVESSGTFTGRLVGASGAEDSP